MNRTAGPPSAPSARANAARRGLARAAALYEDRLTLIASSQLNLDQARAERLAIRIQDELDRRSRAAAAAAADWGQP